MSAIDLLLEAANSGDVKAAEEAISQGADIHARGDAALRYAAQCGHKDMVALLIEKGANVHEHNDAALNDAAEKGHTDIVALLLEKGADIQACNNAALWSASKRGHKDTVALLIENGANVHVRDDAALFDAAQNGHTYIVALLLAKGANVHANDDEALRFAAGNGHTDTAALLLAKGANVHERGDEALREAANNGHIDTVALLIEKGANVHVNNDFALLKAAQDGHTDMAALLIEKGANVHVRDDEALRVAADSGHTAMVALLKASKAMERMLAQAGNSAAQRSMAYQAAAIAAKTGRDEAGIVQAARDAWKVKEHIAFRNDEAAERQAALHSEEALAQRIGVEGYKKAGEMVDMARECAVAVLLPHLLLKAGVSDNMLKAITKENINTWRDKLLPLAAQLMLGGKNVEEQLKMSDEWHIATNRIPAELRPLRGGTWSRLIEPVATPQQYKDIPITIRALATQEELDEEGNAKALDHCVGGYGDECKKGTIHILSVQAGDHRLGTIEVELNNDGTLKERQFRARKNVPPVSEAKAAWEWLQQEIKQNKLTLNQPENGRWGEIAKSSAHSGVVRMIGYYPSPKQVAACWQHYQEHLQSKRPVIHTERREVGGFARPREFSESYRWRNSVGDGSLEGAIKNAGIEKQMDALAEEICGICNTKPPRHSMALSL